MLSPENDLIIQFSAFNDHDRIRTLLIDADLPLPDHQDPPVRFLVARNNRTVVGCLGWEDYKPYVLLRSLVVRKDLRRQGIAAALVKRGMEDLRADGFVEFFLLTEAVEFAQKIGFSATERGELPDAVKTSRQLTALCAKATCMTATGIRA